MFDNSHYMIVDELELTKVLRVIEGRIRRLEIGLCIWSKDLTKWKVGFVCKHGQWKEMFEELKEIDSIVIEA